MGITNREIVEKITGDLVLKVVLWLLIFSYFYNLPVMSYSITGENELRLYDFLGVLFLFRYFQYFKFINLAINKVVFLRAVSVILQSIVPFQLY